MPKRANPFGENSPLQYKTHIGKKEIDMGVNMEQNMQTVYDRTKSLLYQGSRKATECSACGNNQQSNPADHDDLLRPLPGQMRLSPEGRLCVEAEITNQAAVTTGPSEQSISHGDMDTDDVASGSAPSNVDSKPKSPVKQLQIDASGRLAIGLTSVVTGRPFTSSSFCICHSCNRPTHIGTRKCTFCDKPTCTNCINQCCRCQGLFCPVCSVINYDDCVERPYCLQCPANMS